MKKSLWAVVVIVGAAMLCSWDTPFTKTESVKAPIDSLVANWCTSMNNHDSIAVRKQFDPDAILIDEKVIASNAEEISAKWIHPSIRWIGDVKHKKLQEWSTNDRAGYTGKYSIHYYRKNDTPITTTGIFTLNWIKTAKGEWKVTTALIHAMEQTK